MRGECGIGHLQFAEITDLPVMYKDHVDEAYFEDRYMRHSSKIWKKEDFIDQSTFEQNVNFEVRNVSIEGICTAGREIADANRAAYLERVVNSPKMLDKKLLITTLKSRFGHMKRQTMSTFNLMYEMDTFRLEFEVCQSVQ